MKKYKWILLMAPLVFLVIILMLHREMPISESDSKLDSKWLQQIDSTWKERSKRRVSYDRTIAISLIVKHNLFFPLSKYMLLIDGDGSSDILYYGDFKSAIDLDLNLSTDWLNFTLIDKDDSVKYMFFSKGGSGVFDCNYKKGYNKRRKVKVTLFAIRREKYGGQYKVEIPLTKEECEMYFGEKFKGNS